MGSKNPNNDAVCELQSLCPVFKPLKRGLIFRVNAVLKSEGFRTGKGGLKFLPLAANRDRIQFKFCVGVFLELLEMLE